MALSGRNPQRSELNNARKLTQGNVVIYDDNEQTEKSQTHMKASHLSSSVKGTAPEKVDEPKYISPYHLLADDKTALRTPREAADSFFRQIVEHLVRNFGVKSPGSAERLRLIAQ